MPSYHLPNFSNGSACINDRLSFEVRDGFITYFNFMTPIHRQAVDDNKSFRMITSDFCTIGVCKPCEIIKANEIRKIARLSWGWEPLTLSESILHLCEELNKTETNFPGTDLRLVYEIN